MKLLFREKVLLLVALERFLEFKKGANVSTDREKEEDIKLLERLIKRYEIQRL